MTQKEKEILWSICDDIRNGDENADSLVRLFAEIKRMIGYV